MKIYDVYIDGSYSKSNPNETRGAMIIMKAGTPLYARRFFIRNKDFVSMNNVGGELMSALTAITKTAALINEERVGDEVSVINVYHDYIGIRKFADGSWKPSKPATILYRQSYDHIMRVYPYIRVNFIKVKAHSGNKYNDYVDALANGITPYELNSVIDEDYIME